MRLRLKCELLYAPTKMHVYEVRPRKDTRALLLRVCEAMDEGKSKERIVRR